MSPPQRQLMKKKPKNIGQSPLLFTGTELNIAAILAEVAVVGGEGDRIFSGIENSYIEFFSNSQTVVRAIPPLRARSYLLKVNLIV